MVLNKHQNNDIRSSTKSLHILDHYPWVWQAHYLKKLDNDYIILYLYVDDILIFGTSLDAIQRIKDYLSQNFDMKDLGPADMILGMKISRTPNEFFLSLAYSIERMLHKFDFYNAISISTPYDSSVALKKSTCEPVSYSWNTFN